MCGWFLPQWTGICLHVRLMVQYCALAFEPHRSAVTECNSTHPAMQAIHAIDKLYWFTPLQKLVNWQTYEQIHDPNPDPSSKMIGDVLLIIERLKRCVELSYESLRTCGKARDFSLVCHTERAHVSTSLWYLHNSMERRP